MLENLDIFFDLQGFAETATVNGVDYLCIFDEEYSLMGIGVDARQITACFKTTDVTAAGIKQNSQLLIRGKTFKVKSVQPKEDGKLTDLELTQP